MKLGDYELDFSASSKLAAVSATLVATAGTLYFSPSAVKKVSQLYQSVCQSVKASSKELMANVQTIPSGRVAKIGLAAIAVAGIAITSSKWAPLATKAFNAIQLRK